MKATRKASARLGKNEQISFTVDDCSHLQPLTATTPNSTASREEEQQPTPPVTPSVENVKPRDVDSNTLADDEVPPTSQVQYDPLRWFGILVPPTLRACQRSFIAAVDDPVMRAATAGRAMRQVEADIRRLRKDIRKSEKATAATEPESRVAGAGPR